MSSATNSAASGKMFSDLVTVLPDGSTHDILPVFGRLALFLSADFEHEVLAPARPRMSIAGWFRQRNFRGA